MKKRSLIALVCTALIFGSLVPSATAGPGENAVLIEIIAVLRTMHETLTRIREAVASTRETLNFVYPPRVLEQIEHVVDQVRTIQDEVEQISCGWQFSLRTERLWEGLFRGARLCRPEFRDLFGAPPDYVLQDLDEYFDYSATRRLNMVATRVERGPRQQEFLRWLLAEAEHGRNVDGEPYGPGYSQRLSAVGAAALGNVLLEEGDTLTAQLELAQERANDKRLRQKMAAELSLDLYRRLAIQASAPAESEGEVLP
jgi:hypothetical protein